MPMEVTSTGAAKQNGHRHKSTTPRDFLPHSQRRLISNTGSMLKHEASDHKSEELRGLPLAFGVDAVKHFFKDTSYKLPIF